MKNQELRYVTQERAAALLGIPENELSRISEESGLGHKERAGNQEETFFTYEELRQICQMTVQVHYEFPSAPLSRNPIQGSLPPASRGFCFDRKV